jgi:hypothetical protein
MTWTYSSAPGTSGSGPLRDGVRLLIGDTDTNDQQIQDEEIAFALSQGGSDLHKSAAIACRMIAARYARLVDTTVDETGIRARYDQRQKAYHDLAEKLTRDAKTLVGNSGGLGIPAAGGISLAEIETVHELTDRPRAAFKVSTELEIDSDSAPE